MSDTAESPQATNSAEATYLEFLSDAGRCPYGAMRYEMLSLPSQAFWRNPQYFDWLLPADDFGHTGGEVCAPALSREQASRLLNNPSLTPSLMANYLKFAMTYGYVVEHSGLVRPDTTPREYDAPRLALMQRPQIVARALRFLALSDLRGYSLTNSSKAMRFVDGLHAVLTQEWQQLNPNGRQPPSVWAEAALASFSQPSQ